MTVLMRENVPLEARQIEPVAVLRDEFAEQADLRRKTLRVLVVRQHVEQLVAEHRRAAWLQDDHRDSGADRIAQHPECLLQHPLRERPETLVTQRTAAATRLP